MTPKKIQALVDEAITIDRDIQGLEARLKEIKEAIVAFAEADTENQVEGQGGGTAHVSEGMEGQIARVSWPVPTLASKLDPEKKTFARIKELAGKAFQGLFVPVMSYKLKEGFRELADDYLEPRDARALIKLCSTQSKPRVTFETKEVAA